MADDIGDKHINVADLKGMVIAEDGSGTEFVMVDREGKTVKLKLPQDLFMAMVEYCSVASVTINRKKSAVAWLPVAGVQTHDLTADGEIGVEIAFASHGLFYFSFDLAQAEKLRAGLEPYLPPAVRTSRH